MTQTVKNSVKGEVVKMMTLPSTFIILGVTVVGGLLVTGLITHANVSHLGGGPKGSGGFDPTAHALIGMIVAGLTAGVFGALLVTSEYSSGTMRTSLAATPRRFTLLAAKIGVAAAATIVFSEVLSFISFFLGQAILSGGGAPHANLDSPGAFRAVTMTGLFIALFALLAFGLGLICRSTAGAISAFVGVVFVLPLVMQAISANDGRYVPTNILTDSIMATVKQGPRDVPALSPGVGLLLMAIYTVVALTAGTLLFVKRDA